MQGTATSYTCTSLKSRTKGLVGPVSKVKEKKKYLDVETPSRRVRALEAPLEALGYPVALRRVVVELFLRHLGFSGLGFRVWVLGFGVHGLRFGV